MNQTEIWFKGRKLKKDYRPVKIQKALNSEEQEVVRSFFRYLLILKNDYSVSVIMTAYRRARMTNTHRGKGFLYANI